MFEPDVDSPPLQLRAVRTHLSEIVRGGLQNYSSSFPFNISSNISPRTKTFVRQNDITAAGFKNKSQQRATREGVNGPCPANYS